MKTLLIIFLFSSSLLLPFNDISMHGIKINDPKSSLKKIRLEVMASDETMTRYRTENGNDLSVTISDDKVVYMENDWLHEVKGVKPLFSVFKFGETTLRQIRKAFGTNGFTYVQRNDLVTETDIVEFNCFELDSPNNEVLVIITKAPLKPEPTEANLADKLKLESIVIADKKYLDSIWGSDKTFDPQYKKINLSKFWLNYVRPFHLPSIYPQSVCITAGLYGGAVFWYAGFLCKQKTAGADVGGWRSFGGAQPRTRKMDSG
ncbi:MAG TPA: hypothetical protein VK668_17220 [Mucilaginibacter sp.]|nr:hypothetical protein [Mucilaginibacter sp.]